MFEQTAINYELLFIIICVIFLVLFLLYKLTIGKKKRFAKPGEVQQRVQYDKRYPNRGKILKKEYNLEDNEKESSQE